METLNPISERLIPIRETLKRSAREPVRILAVTKFQPLERLREAVLAGIDLLGVNYVQEGEEQREQLSDATVDWHFIGHIQSRKVKFLTSYGCVQSLDRIDVAEALNERCSQRTSPLPVLVEVNVGAESEKSGISPSELPDFLRQIANLKRLAPAGLMIMPPPLPNIEERRPFFKKARGWFEQFRGEYPFTTLSMGTSEDYAVAVEEGSTLIRLGTSLLGAREKRVT